jgi:hypothetical protein
MFYPLDPNNIALKPGSLVAVHGVAGPFMAILYATHSRGWADVHVPGSVVSVALEKVHVVSHRALHTINM